MTEEHAADEAAGEVIYSSDGLPPIVKVTPAPPPVVQSSEDGTGGDVLDTGSGGTPAQAFEVFSGKLYPVTAAHSSLYNKAETPAQRLARLKQEVEELEKDLAGGGAEAAAGGGEEVIQMVTNLKERIAAQTGASTKTQLEMTQSIQQHLQEWEKSKQTVPATADGVPAEAGIVYELYGGMPQPASATGTGSYEERLLQIEKLIGTSSSNASVLSRLEEMETLLKNLDPKQLEQASAKAKVIRSDLEAASKARNKLASAATFRKEDAKTITALYDAMVQTEGLSQHLPALVARLSQLATLHAQSSTFSVRLAQSEKDLTQLEALTKSLEETVTKVETGMAENVKVMEKNLQQLDERIGKL